MNTLVSADRPSHWYRHDNGAWMPFYEIESANGNGLRPVTLRDARKVSAVPSVTNVLNVVAKPGLESWKATQYIEAALTLPKRPEEPLDEYARRVVEDAEQRSAKARDFGSRLHKAIEPGAMIDPDLEPFVAPVRVWMAKNILDVHGSELTVGNQQLGYAGRLDLDCNYVATGRAVIDFKTQAVKNDKPAFYREWARQLAAYQRTRPIATPPYWPAIVSVVIDSVTPRAPFVHVWDQSEVHYHMFCLCLELWKDEKGYDPAKP